jgi:GntR family transcriptional regulator / MocR family aminotransferase
VVLYLGTLSKLLTPGFRLGFVVAPTAFTEALVRHRQTLDLQGNQAMERAVSELLEEGLLQRHARKMGRIYHARRTALVEALERHLSHLLQVSVPSGGMSLWLPTQAGLDVDAWAAAGVRKLAALLPRSTSAGRAG